MQIKYMCLENFRAKYIIMDPFVACLDRNY